MNVRKKRRKKSAENRLRPKKIKRVNTGEFLDRDLSLLEFNKRVLEQAMDTNMPLLERVKFLSIFHSNLDEFFMKRVDLSRRVRIHNVTQEDGEEKVITYEQHKFIRKAVENLLNDASECFNKSIRPSLESCGLELLEWSQLKPEEIRQVNRFFMEKVFPILTPLAVDPGHPFPHISNLSTSLAVCLKYPHRSDPFFARVKIPAIFPAWIQLGKKGAKKGRWIKLTDIVERNLEKLFPNMEIAAVMPFRVTRNIELEKEDDETDDILEMMEQLIKDRRFGDVVKLEVPTKKDTWLLRFLMEELELAEDDIYTMNSEIDFTSLKPIWNLDIPPYKFEPWQPRTPKVILEDPLNIFHAISESDILVHHPYDSFSSTVENFIRTASEDPQVIGIKITLYRTDEGSRLMRALMRAAEAGKQVVCLIEVKARFDEARNITWAQALEDSGVHIVYGIVGLKTHCKVALVVRQEKSGIKSYAHIGTGNYNAQTANLYTDLGLFTAKKEITSELIELFHHLTGRSQKREYPNLLVAPTNMKKHFLDLIAKEEDNAKKGLPARIIAKCNGLEDKDICASLYLASQAGVKVDLIVRGMCVLRPGTPEISENIRVISVVDRFLEHSRIYYFQNNSSSPKQSQIYIGSADWMNRNLERRVEVCTPLLEEDLKVNVFEILETMLSDRSQAWEMKPDGSYVRLKPTTQNNVLSAQQLLMLKASDKDPRKL